MGAHPAQLCESIFPVPYEWAMKNFSASIFNLPDQQHHNPEHRGKGKAKEKTDQLEQEEEEEGSARCEWDINLASVVSSTTVGARSDTLGVIEFDPSDRIVATGGIARKIRIYSLSSLLPNRNSQGEHEHEVNLLDHGTVCDFCICTPAKLSSLRWKPGSGGLVLGSGDYDGVVTEYDLERKIPVFERDEHGGRRVWSMDYSHSDLTLGASGSDDGSMQMWDPRCGGGGGVATVQPSMARSPVCCVEFDPFGGALIAVGCADRKAYGYDIRRMADPVLVFDGHRKTVSYVRFLDSHMMMTASIDGCLKLWDTVDPCLVRTYKGHTNNRSFVGLSIWRNGGLIVCGSENNQVFVYDKRWGEPIWMHEFEPMARLGSDHGFVSSVCWRQVGEDQCTLLAGGSDGVLQVFNGKRKSF